MDQPEIGLKFSVSAILLTSFNYKFYSTITISANFPWFPQSPWLDAVVAADTAAAALVAAA